MKQLQVRPSSLLFFLALGLLVVILMVGYVYLESKKSKAEGESQIANIKINIKLTFQGITQGRELEGKKLKTKLTVVDQAIVSKYPFDIDFVYHKPDGTWQGSLDITGLDIAKKYFIFVKGPMHLQQRICDLNPDVLPNSLDRYSCTNANISFNAGENSLDFGRVVLRAGDLPIQDGIANSADIARVRQNLGKKDSDILAGADVNLDGVIDTQDYSLVIDGLLIQTDDQIPATVTPTPSLTVTPTPSATAPTPTSTTPTPTNLTPTPTSQPSGQWSAPSVLAKGGKFPWVVVDSSGVSHLTWGDPASKTVWYGSCQQSISSCAKTKINTDLESYYPAISLDSSVNSHVVWESRVPTAETYAVYYSRLTGSNWSEAIKISSEPYAEVPTIAVSTDNTLHVVYQSTNGSTISIYYRSSSDGVNWSTPYLLGNGYRPKVKSANSKIHVVWMSGSEPYSIYYRNLQNGSWSSQEVVSSGNKDQIPDIAIDSQGTVHIVWLKDKVSSYAKIQGATVTDLKNNLGESLEYSYWPKIALDESNNAHIAFQGKTVGDGKWGIYVRSRNGQMWDEVKTLSQTNVDQQSPSISLNQSNGTIVFTNGTDVLVSFLQ